MIEQFESNKFDLHTAPDKIEEGQFLGQKKKKKNLGFYLKEMNLFRLLSFSNKQKREAEGFTSIMCTTKIFEHIRV